MQINRRILFFLSLSTLLIFSLIGIGMIHFFREDKTVMQLLMGNWPMTSQIFYGLAYGLAIALMAISLVETNYLRPVTTYFRELFKQSEIGIRDILFASISAGIGEELLFRGGIQYFLGIWLTAIIFVAIHGYLNPSNSKLFLYGLLMVFLSAGLGYLCDYVGIVSAMIGHTMFDIVMFWHLIYRK